VVPSLSNLIEQARLAARSGLEYGEGLMRPTARLGITGLSHTGKTVFSPRRCMGL
jgi:predicted YcjX-like family ATPase